MKREIIIYHESLLQSIIKDIFTYSGIIAILFINYFLLNNNVFTGFIFLMMFLTKIAVNNSIKYKENIFYNKEDAIKKIESF